MAIACAWAATSGEQAVVGWFALIWAAQVFMSLVYCSTDGGWKLMPSTAASTTSTAPTLVATPLVRGSMSLSVKIRISSGRKAIRLMIAPSWFWKKNRAVSEARAGSFRLAAFHNRLPAIAKTAMPIRIPSSSGWPPWSKA